MTSPSMISAAKAQADRDIRAAKDAAASLSAFRWSVESAERKLAQRAAAARASLAAYAAIACSTAADQAIVTLGVTDPETATPEAVKAILALPESLPEETIPALLALVAALNPPPRPGGFSLDQYADDIVAGITDRPGIVRV